MSHFFLRGKLKAADVKVDAPVTDTQFLLLSEQRECCCSTLLGAGDESEQVCTQHRSSVV